MKQGKEGDTLIETHIRTHPNPNQPPSGRFSKLVLNMTDFSQDGTNKYIKKLAKKIKKLNTKIES